MKLFAIWTARKDYRRSWCNLRNSEHRQNEVYESQVHECKIFSKLPAKGEKNKEEKREKRGKDIYDDDIPWILVSFWCPYTYKWYNTHTHTAGCMHL